jgi:membrane protein DedA with SNARE-associated domain
MGIPLPGETTLIAASYLATTRHFSLPLVIVSAALGSVVGDSIGYAIGRKGGRRFLDRYGRYVRITPEKLAKADRYFVRRGAKTVFLGRFFPLLRILSGPLAGTSKMTYPAVSWRQTSPVLSSGPP